MRVLQAKLGLIKLSLVGFGLDYDRSNGVSSTATPTRQRQPIKTGAENEDKQRTVGLAAPSDNRAWNPKHWRDHESRAPLLSWRDLVAGARTDGPTAWRR